MTSIPSIRYLSARTNAPILRAPLVLASRRPYSNSSYGGENQNVTGNPTTASNSAQTKEREHPGPPPPNVSKNQQSSSGSQPSSSSASSSTSKPSSSDPGPSQGHPVSQTPSNKAHPTLSDGRQSPYVDREGQVSDDVSDDVKQHNAEMEGRYDRPFNQLSNEGKVHKGFGPKGN